MPNPIVTTLSKWALLWLPTFLLISTRSYTQSNHTISPPALANLVQVEYYIDNDPGYGNAIAVSISNVTDLANQSISINPASLSQGVHRVGVRGKDANGAWSLDNSWLFYKPYSSTSSVQPPPAIPNISTVEYYIDNDPGLGKGTPVSITSSSDLANLALSIDPSLLTQGVHRIGLRGKDANGAWSLDNSWLFFKPYSSSSNIQPPPAIPNISTVEYYIDNDPGLGKGTAISFAPGTDLADLSINIDPSLLTQGVHRIGLRGKDANGAWSLDNSWLFFKPYSSSSNIQPPPAIPNLQKAEYYFDKDPGFGKGQQISISSITDISDINLSINITNLSVGNHVFYVRGMDANGAWSLDNKFAFAVQPPNALTITIGSAPAIICAGNSFKLPVTANGLFATANIFTAQLSDAAGGFGSPVNVGTLASGQADSIPVTIPGSIITGNSYRIRVLANNPADTSSNTSTDIHVSKSPQLSVGILGKTNVCHSTETYTASNPETGVIYNWTLSGGGTIDTSGSTATVHWTQAGSFTLNVKTATDCGSGPQASLQVFSSIDVPFVAPTVSASGQNLYASGYSGTTGYTGYQWFKDGSTIAGQTSSYYYAAVAGNYSVAYTNSCGIGTQSNSISISFIGITSFTPTSGVAGISVTLLGTGFTGTTSVSFNGTNTTSYTVVNDNTITVNVPVGASTGVITVQAPAGNAVSSTSFTVAIPPYPVTLISPSNSATAIALTGNLQWNAAKNNPSGYKVYLGTDSLNMPVVADLTSTFYSYSLSASTKYYWRVVPYNSYGSTTGFSTWSFTTKGLPPSCVTAIYPVNSASGISLHDTLRWNNAGSTATGYYVGLSTNSNSSVLQYGTANTYLPVSLASNTTYYWQVVPYNQDGSPAGCPKLSFSTVACSTPFAVASGPTTLCKGQSVTLTANGGTHVKWNTGDTSRSITVNGAGSYYATVDSSGGCSANTHVITVTRDIAPILNTGTGTGICPGDILTLTYTGLRTVSWSTGEITASITVHPAVSTTYFVSGTSAAGCSYSDSTKIVVNPAVAPAAVTNMLPSDNAVNLSLPFNLSWLPGLNNTKFDIYVWKTNATQPSVPLVSNTTAINYTLNAGLIPGNTYQWQIISKNGNCFNIAGPIQSFTIKDLPDLTVSTVTAPKLVASGQPVSVAWTVKNIGNGTTGNNAWLDHVWLSADTILQDNPPATDFYLGGIPNLTALEAGQSYSNISSFTVPNGIAGTYHVIIKTNQLGTQSPISSILEKDNSNNQIISDSLQINLTPSPDLQVSSLTLPVNAFSGLTVNIKWNVANKGADMLDAAAKWNDKVYISFAPAFSASTSTYLTTVPHSGGLLHDRSYQGTASITIPKYISGLYYIYIVTDADNKVYEEPYEGNNVSSDVINVYLTPPPDLSAESITAPSIVASGASIPVTYTVKNVGANPTDNGWVDALYLSKNSNYDLSGAVAVGSNYRYSILNAGDSYNNQANMLIPQAITGSYYLYLKANNTNSLFEYNTQNNMLRSDTTITISNSDLVVDSIRIPSSANSGNNVTITYRLRNIGSSDVINAPRMDYIYISPKPAFDQVSATVIGKSVFTESISSGSSATKQATVTLPNGISGNNYMYVYADATNLIYESNENNNVSAVVNNTPGGKDSVAVVIGLTSTADLVASNVIIPATALAGFKIPISFTVKNIGSATAAGTTWTDNVYLSPSRVWNPLNASLLASFAHSQSLSVNNSYTVNDSVKITVDNYGHLQAGGKVLDNTFGYVFVFTDAANKLFEYQAENNNISPVDSSFFFPPRIDLEVTDVYSSDSAYAGQLANVYWTVRNNGLSTAYKGLQVPCYWYDGVYLSKDTVWDASDIFVTDWGYSDTPHDSSYTDSRNFIVPNGLSGDYYLLLVADHKFNIHEDVKRGNNYILIRDEDDGHLEQFYIIASPYPDLIVAKETAPATGTSGQPVTVKWTTQNNGVGKTISQGWEDGIFLSTDNVLDASDKLVGRKAHSTNLLAGGTYDDSLDVSLPVTASGSYVLIVSTDYHNAVFEDRGENNNTKYSYISITAPAPCDLIVQSVSPPFSGIAGQQINIPYTLKNIGSNPATGIMTDGIYLSKDSIWDISDILLGTVKGSLNLAPNGTVNRALSMPLTGTVLGSYQIIVRTDLLNNIPEIDETNNNLASIDTLQVNVKQLRLNTSTPDILPDSTNLYYRIDIPDSLKGQTLLITLQGDKANASNELYARYGDVPSRAVFDFNQGTVRGGDQEVLIPALQPGTYYIAGYGNTTVGNTQAVSFYASVLPFAIRNVNSNTGGNTGSVTLSMNGSKFELGMQVQLSNSSGNVITASQVYYINTNQLFARFELKGQALGIYDITATKTDHSQTTLAKGFTIAAGTGGGFYASTDGTAGPGCDPGAANGINSQVQVGLQYPASTRRQRIVAITVFFGNAGNVDIPAPNRFVYSTAGAPLSFDVDGLSKNLQILQLEFKEANGPPNILRPGATGSITFYTKAIAPLTFILTKD